MENKFKDKLYKIFKKDSRLWDKEKKEFNETLLKDLIDKLDEKIIELLFGDKEAKEKFFIKIKDIFVLRQNDLKFFIDENKLDNSYTQYQNKIGLRVGNKLLSERDEVVLDWPFKDCVLEGGMTKEDQKRNEILTSDGSIYINIDYNETHYLKILMDEVFGRKNFQREIIWRIGWLSGYKTIAKNYIRNHDTILFYTKDSNNFVFNKAYNTIKDYADRFNAVNKKEILEKLEQFKLCKKDREEFFKYISEIGLPKKYPLEDTWNSSIYDKLNSIAVVSYSGEKVSKMLGVDEIKGQKSEKLLQRIIEVSTNENDIVLDYHIGTGTTCAVAHKLNRQYIGIEQMDYIENTAVARLKEVIKGERAGVSVSVEWQGGGDFVYLELAKWNEEAREKILKAKSLSELEKLFDELYERYFLNYNVKTKEFKEKTIKEEEFKKLGLDKQKKLFVEMLDMNQMYVNFSERADKKYKLTKEDIALSEEFYNSK